MSLISASVMNSAFVMAFIAAIVAAIVLHRIQTRPFIPAAISIGMICPRCFINDDWGDKILKRGQGKGRKGNKKNNKKFIGKFFISCKLKPTNSFLHRRNKMRGHSGVSQRGPNYSCAVRLALNDKSHKDQRLQNYMLKLCRKLFIANILVMKM